MGEAIGYVVVEYNQASRMPDLPCAVTLHRSVDDARAEMEDLAAETARVGRRERYAIAAVILEDDDA
ncbi:hypothetical protein [Sphaerimonospora thailandensis]|uniref:Uncharacterized protein n=1 Tax=Sphaerimonospora thailandensis TaxID=795644 RepID=A0A8J3R8Q1_9ACTN|nr:hypothetical protein [Sphaerimonospora thailandensis]GIH69459.1 hypothetical protein Mth01_17120 [Sphaerimonospora thailandensis]